MPLERRGASTARGGSPRSRGLAVGGLAAASLAVAACGWDPSRPFERNAPAVEEALLHLDAGHVDAAADVLEGYLGTGPCAEGNIGTPDKVKARPSGTFDLGLTLFKLGETFGARFGEEERGKENAAPGAPPGQTPPDPRAAQRKAQVDCALRLLPLVAEHAENPPLLRAKARYLAGNLHFLAGEYEDAVKEYDAALLLEPGQPGDAGDYVGRDAAWNRAIALRRIEEKKKQQNDAGPPPDGGQKDDKNQDKNDAGQDPPPPDGGQDKPDGGQEPPRPDGGNDKQDGGAPPQEPDSGAPPDEPDAGGPPPPPPPRANADDRILDQLENAPTVQQEDARKNAQRRRVRGMADK